MATLALTVLFAVFAVIGALFGLVRGLNKAVIRIITLALAAVLTFVIAGPVTTSVVDTLGLGEMIIEMIRSEETVATVLDTAPLLQQAILVAPAFVLSIVVFPVVFLVLKFVTWVLFLCIQKPLRRLIFKDSCKKEDAALRSKGARVAQRLGGLGVGLVTGAVIFAMLLTPVLGLFSLLPPSTTVDEALDAMVEQNALSAADAQIIREGYAVTDCTLVRAFRAVGVSAAGKHYINSVSKIQADGQTMYLADEFGSLLSIAQTAVEGGLLDALQSADDQTALYALLSDKAFMDALMQDMFQSKMLRSAVPEVMAFAMESAASGLNVPANKEAVYHNMMDGIAQAVKNAGVDYAAIKAYEDAHGAAYTLARTGSAQQPGVLTQEEYEAQIQKLVDLAEQISAILNRSLSGDNAAFADSVADHIVNEVKTQAAENGQAVVDNFDASGVQTAIAGIDASNVDAGDADAGQLLEQLADQEKFETDVATVETIKESIRETVKNALADDTKAEETATTLANVVSDFAGAVAAATDENGNLDASKLDFEKIASAVSELQNSNLKDVGTSVLDMVANGDLGGNAMIGDVMNAVKEGYEKGEDIGGTIGTAGALIGLGSAMSGSEPTQEGMVSSLTSLINNLNDYTISLLPTILSPETLTSMGLPAEYAESTYSVIETLLKELMKLKGAEDYENEVNTILSLYNLATTGVEDFKEEDIADLVGYAVNSDAIFNTLVSVSSSNPFGIQIEDEGTRENIAKAIEDHFEQSGKTQRERDIYMAVATLLGLDEEVNLAQ